MTHAHAHLHMIDGDELTLGDGSAARRNGDALEIRDADGHIVVRYRAGEAEIHVANGDLKLAAPRGRVRIESGLDVHLDAGRDVVASAKRKASFQAATLQASAQRTELTTGVGRLVANHVQMQATSLITRVEKYELTASRLVERSENAFREVSDLLQTKSGRVRSFVEGVYAKYTGRTVMVSDKDTSIDGEKVLLG